MAGAHWCASQTGGIKMDSDAYCRSKGLDPTKWKDYWPGPCRVYLVDDGIKIDRVEADSGGAGVEMEISFDGTNFITLCVLPRAIWIGMPRDPLDRLEDTVGWLIGVRIPEAAEATQ
jgi:hypothetical protein